MKDKKNKLIGTRTQRMLDVYLQMLESALFTSAFDNRLSVVAESSSEDEADSNGSFQFPHQAFSDICPVKIIPDGEHALPALKSILQHNRTVDVFLVPPFLTRRRLSASLRAEYEDWDLHMIAVHTTLQQIQASSNLGTILPVGVLNDPYSAEWRSSVRAQATLKLVLEHDHSMRRFGIAVHDQLRMVTLIMKKGQDQLEPVKFFKCPDTNSQQQASDVLQDFRKLLRQQGGKTSFGYVKRELPNSSLWGFDINHPKLVENAVDLEHLGSLQRLEDLYDLFSGVRIETQDGVHLGIESNDSVPVITGREILADSTLNYDEPRYSVRTPHDSTLLKPLDIVVRQLTNLGRGGEIRLARVGIGDPVSVAGSNTIVLRPKSNLSEEDGELVLAYLKSRKAKEWLIAHNPGFSLSLHTLKGMPVPTFDGTLRLAVQEMKEAAIRFESWKKAIDRSIDSFFEYESAKNSRVHLLSTGRKIRQRMYAALLADELTYRIRTQFPHPLAYRWRTVEAAVPNTEGYWAILETAEIFACFLACIAVVAVNAVLSEGPGYIRSMATQLTQKGKGTSFGDWISILQEVNSSKQLHKTGKQPPFYEVTNVFSNSTTEEILREFMAQRNDYAHGRRPSETHMKEAFERSRQALLSLYGNCEFLSEYPLRYVESTRRDSLARVTHYNYREQMGDHSLVPVMFAQAEDADLETGSLYLFDRDKRHYLLRPFVSRRFCPQCGSWETFFLDKYLAQQKSCQLKSMERGHTLVDSDIVSSFEYVKWLEH